MKYIKLFENFENGELVPPKGWKLTDQWEGNNGDPNFVFGNASFEITIEFWDHTKSYSIGFHELGDNYIVPLDKRYQKSNIKPADVQKELDEMSNMLNDYTD
jgi:hypothetical protein